MSGPGEPIRRILVALDASAASLAALEAAAEIAERLHAELAGLFVEEEDLLRLAGLPFARAYSAEAADLGRLDVGAMRRALKVQADRARHALETVARRRRLTWSFRVAQGAAAAALAAAARECDLLGLGIAGGTHARRARLGSTARATLATRACSVMVLRREESFGERLVVLDSGNDRLLDQAAALASGLGLRLDIIAFGADPARIAARERAIGAWRARVKAPAHIGALVTEDPARIARAIQAKGRGLVVGAAEGPFGDASRLEALVEALDLPFLLLR
jgi:nucleotide-binding universal stress UspA family protein